jgi:hypothetical protein
MKQIYCYNYKHKSKFNHRTRIIFVIFLLYCDNVSKINVCKKKIFTIKVRSYLCNLNNE